MKQVIPTYAQFLHSKLLVTVVVAAVLADNNSQVSQTRLCIGWI